jgi:hypothetical protein
MPNDVRLCRAQKCDLLRMAAAAFVSTGFFVMSLILAHGDRAAPAQSVAAREPAAVVATRVAAPDINREVRPAAPARTRRHARATTMVKTQRQPRAERTANLKRVTSRGDGDRSVVRAAAMPVGRKVARLITGDGRYSIRPFPSVATSGS